jgi:RNA-directed DNA polymerase
MSQKTLERLEYLRKANRNRWWINHDLYRLMYKEDLYMIAYERIKSKPGNMTPGTDEETLDGFSLGTIRETIQEMRTEQFRFKPVRQQFIPKPNGKMRKLGIPTMQDRAMQALYLLALDPVAETTADPNSYGFRQSRSTADAIEACYIALCRNDRAEWILEGDIRSGFDRISHAWLLAHIPIEKTILKKWLKAGYMEHHRFHITEEGTPQGGVLTPPTMWQKKCSHSCTK